MIAFIQFLFGVASLLAALFCAFGIGVNVERRGIDTAGKRAAIILFTYLMAVFALLSIVLLSISGRIT